MADVQVASVAGTNPPPAQDGAESTSQPEVACETLYIQNLNEKVKIDVLKSSLRGLFKSYGEVLDVVAHSNLRMRGQAFVSFASPEVAAKALREVKGFPLYSKPMQISFARTRSDAVVKRLDPQSFEVHKTRRSEHKKNTRYTNPLKQKLRAKRLAAAGMSGIAAMPAPKRPAVQMPDEYLPPNKILFLQNLPESVTKDQLMALFSQYPNLYEVRLIPTKKDIAFVEYMDETSASVAKDALHNYKLDGENKIKALTKEMPDDDDEYPDDEAIQAYIEGISNSEPEKGTTASGIASLTAPPLHLMTGRLSLESTYQPSMISSTSAAGIKRAVPPVSPSNPAKVRKTSSFGRTGSNASLGARSSREVQNPENSLDPFFVAHCPRVQELLNKKELAWGTVFELARGVTNGSWDWSMVTEERLSQLQGTNAEAAHRVAAVMVGRQVPVTLAAAELCTLGRSTTVSKQLSLKTRDEG
ncbi:hypothetical protein ID866_8927 [Astraeus odoratus]|nr:hypothetical protein ID866_8927 [Astraeus odoratus]